LTNLDKVFFPEQGYNKGDVIAYYESVSKYILKYLKQRPLSLKRNPGGITDPGFYQKDAGEQMPDWVETKTIWSEGTERNIDYVVCNDKATLLYLANLGCIEFNPWHSRVDNLEHPDFLLIDLDPADENSFEHVIETAKAVKEVLDEAGAKSFVKTSGSTGLHICIPMGRKYDYDQVRMFSELIAHRVVEMLPELTSTERNLKKRGQRIYVDFMQNRIGQTVASVYSIRPRNFAPVSMPLDWKEVKKGLTIEQFNIKNALKRIEEKGDLFAGVLGRGINMENCLKRIG
jgi:bifunctional non-homologous end joining protein LigD